MEEIQEKSVYKIMRGLIAMLILGGAVFYLAYNHESFVKVENTSETASSTPVQLLFTGDIMLDRTVRTTIDTYGFDHSFEAIKSIFGGVDMAVGNLEGTITENRSISQANLNILKFTFATSTATSLKRLGFTGVSLANNHALDFGKDGYSDTEKNLDKAGLFYFGSPLNNQNISVEVPTAGEKVCLVGYHQLFASSTIPVIKEIENIKSHCSFTVVFAHWGEEYSAKPTSAQRVIGHAFVDAGADLVIGAHPHVIEPMEIYENHAIFYSLGNFIFDQDFSLPTRQGLAVRLELSSSTEKFHLIGLEMEKSLLYFPEKEAFQHSLDTLISELPPVHKVLADVDGMVILKRGQ